MGKIKEIKEEESDEKILSPQEQASRHLKANKEKHTNFEPDHPYQTPCSSLIANSVMKGGLCAGAHRMIGNSSGGKSSCTLDFMLHFLKVEENRRGLFIDAEGKLKKEVKERSGIKFTTNPEEWENGTCLILETNVYEFVFDFLRELMSNNPTKTKYFFVIDSMDCLIKGDDLKKDAKDSEQVGGGALLTSTFLKKTASAMAKRGHTCVFINQVRATIKINPQQKTNTNQQDDSTGPNAEVHAAVWVLKFKARFQEDIIREDENDKKSKVLGHYCNIKIIKCPIEKYGEEFSYPIKYGRTGGTSVWVERELSSYCLMWEHIKRDKNTYSWEDSLYLELKGKFHEVPEKFVGMGKLEAFFEEKKEISDYLCKKFQGNLK